MPIYRTKSVLLFSAYAAALCSQPASALQDTPSSFLAPSKTSAASTRGAAKAAREDHSPSSFLAPSKTSAASTREAAKAAREDHLRHTLIDHLSLLLLGLDGNSSSLAAAVSEAEEHLLPIITASPKNEYGNLEDEAARYALHRLFMARHGWHFNIFDTPTVASLPKASNSSTIFSFQGHLPENVRELLERQFQRHHGYGHLELAVFVAAVEHVIFAEVPSRLSKAYHAKAISVDHVASVDLVKDLVDLHMAAYITNYDLSHAKPVDVFKLITNMPHTYYDWYNTRVFFRGIEASLAIESGEYRFSDISRIVKQIEKEFIHLNNQQCTDLKEKLVSMETKSSGRVRLLDFYNSGSDVFTESREYLRELGNLDETDPLEPRVIISNYLDGPNNCVAMTSFYSVCCADECADLYGHIETSLGKPEATPSEILPVIQTLASPSSDSCSSVAVTLERRLHDIANRKKGVVSLHGAEFAEWMHFVYPRECTQASLFGSARYMTTDEWQAKNARLSLAISGEELREQREQLNEMQRAKELSSNATKDEWDVAAAASWHELDEVLPIDSDRGLLGKSPVGGGLQKHSMMVGFVAVASLPVVVIKLLANTDAKSSECLKSHII